jgi:hypothetical protein
MPNRVFLSLHFPAMMILHYSVFDWSIEDINDFVRCESYRHDARYLIEAFDFALALLN